MRNISILGCGWLGMPLGSHLAELGWSVKGSSRNQDKLEIIRAHQMEAYPIDLESDHEPGTFFDSEILILTIPPSNTSNAEGYFDQLKKVKDWSEKGKIKNIIFISSTSVYPNENKVASENEASDTALTRSGISLVKAEKMFQSEKNSIIRFAGLIGENRHPGRWFAGKKNVSGGHVPVNMIHLQDCISIIQTIIEGQYWGEAFNACFPEHPQKQEYYAGLSLELGLEPPEFSTQDELNWKIVSSAYLCEKTGYKFKRSIWEI